MLLSKSYWFLTVENPCVFLQDNLDIAAAELMILAVHQYEQCILSAHTDKISKNKHVKCHWFQLAYIRVIEHAAFRKQLMSR